MNQRILVVEDEEDILELVRYNLEKEGLTTLSAATGEEGLEKAFAEVPDLVLLDLMLPGLDGFEVCKRLKGDKTTENIPIIMLTAKGEDVDVVCGLELGADDYITKPMHPRVLIARIRAVLRRSKRSEANDPELIKHLDLTIHPARHEVKIDETPIDLSATEFSILLFLAKHPGWVFTRNQIISAVKGDDYPVTDRSVDVQIVGLRKKLGDMGSYIETVRGVGYRFKED